MTSWKTAHKRRKNKETRLLLARIRLRLLAQDTRSPEQTGHYECPDCGNRKNFIGIDEHGYGGPEVCDFEEHQEEGAECDCLTELTQPFTVLGPDNDIDYHEFTGGGCDSEIGSYTQIVCAECDTIIWEEPERELPVAA